MWMGALHRFSGKWLDISACGCLVWEDFSEWHFAWASGSMPFCEESNLISVAAISACEKGRVWMSALILLWVGSHFGMRYASTEICRTALRGRRIGQRRYASVFVCRGKHKIITRARYIHCVKISMNIPSISACGKGGEWHFALYLRTCFISVCELWQWPFRGIRIGEAKNPGPPKSSRWNEENEAYLFGSGPELIASPN